MCPVNPPHNPALTLVLYHPEFGHNLVTPRIIQTFHTLSLSLILLWGSGTQRKLNRFLIYMFVSFAQLSQLSKQILTSLAIYELLHFAQ